MIILYSEIRGQPVGALAESTKAGTVNEIIINPEDGRVLGLIIGTGLLMAARRAVSWLDVRSIAKDGVVVNSEENILPLDEIVRMAKLVLDDQNNSLIGNSVETTAGNKLGRVDDFAIDSEAGILAQIYVKSLLGPTRIISHKSIVRIEPEKIIVRNGEAKKIVHKVHQVFQVHKVQSS